MQKRKAVVVATLGATLIGSMALMADNHFNNMSSNNSSSVNTKDNYNQIHKINQIYSQTVFNNNFCLNVNKAIHNTQLNESARKNVKYSSKQKIKVKTIKVKNISNTKAKVVRTTAKVQQVQKQINQVDTMNNTEYKWLDIPLSHEQQKWVFDLCKRNRIDAYLVFAIMKEETQFQNKTPNANNRCMGIMQIDNVTAKDTLEWLYRTDRQQYNEIIKGYSLVDYYTSVHMGICTLKKLYIIYNSDDLKPLLVYGCGSGRAEQLIKQYGYFQPKFVREWFNYQWQLQTYGKIVKEL